jgi:hypothetical protein
MPTMSMRLSPTTLRVLPSVVNEGAGWVNSLGARKKTIQAKTKVKMVVK